MFDLPLVVKAAASVLRLQVSNPRRLAQLARHVGGLILDAEFEELSTIRPIPDSLQERLDEVEVRLPAPAQFDKGNQSSEGLRALVALAMLRHARRVFEFGTYNGLTALTLARNLSGAEVHTLDIPPVVAPSLPVLSSDLPSLTPRRRLYEREPEAGRITQYLSDSALFAYGPVRNQFDLVYIDGAHSFEYVANDTRIAMEISRPDGVIVWDDYWRRVPDVARYLRTLTLPRIYRVPHTRLVVHFRSPRHI